ncbi:MULTISPECIES: DUF4232 domain-containing protein [Actinosynnema]|uniref:DUF4232 domain-containing protein n=1 Tax=Actinosynnema TaxID=40566 RepID=UPI0020A32745|nr:DUF4232 domain-containing protein [Actinosynnema pretiosum]MCP2097948.1 Protein of unknown function (DUF4232) [Actinosynnema pretiosum]
MRRTTRTTAMVSLLAACAAVTACASSTSGSASPGSGSGGDPISTEPAASSSQVSQTPTGQAPTGQAGDGQAAAAECASLTPSAGQPQGDTQKKLPLVMTNTGDTACTLSGFPGVQLVGADGHTWDLTRSSDTTPEVTLQPGGTATSYLSFLPASADPWDVKTVRVTPPNTTATADLPWTFGPVTLQDGATRPGTYIGPVNG